MDLVDRLVDAMWGGMAWVYTQYAPMGSPLYAIEAEARATRRGLWNDTDPVAPWNWRRRVNDEHKPRR